MKRKLNAAEYALLTDAQKLMYVAEGDSFILPLLDHVDPGPIERARDRERDAASELRTQLAAANAELTTLRSSTPKDVQTLTRAHNEALNTQRTEYETRLTSLRGQQEQSLLSNAAKDLSSGLTSSPENAAVVLPHVAAKFAVEWNGDVATVKIKNSDGSLGSSYTPETAKGLKKEFVDNPLFAAIVVKSSASGGGAAGVQNGSGSGGAGGGSTKKFAEMSGAEKTALLNDNQAEFNRLAGEHKAEANARRFGPIKPLIQN